MIGTYPIFSTYRQILSVAAAFWGTCLALVVAEVAIGSNIVIGAVFVLSIPLLVAVLTWVNKGIVFDRGRRTAGSVLNSWSRRLSSSSACWPPPISNPSWLP